MANDPLLASIIADGFHLPDAFLRVVTRAKGLERLVLVSDAAFLAGSDPGIATWGETSVEIHADGHLSVAGTEFLAGAGHLLDRCIARFIAATGLPTRQSSSARVPRRACSACRHPCTSSSSVSRHA